MKKFWFILIYAVLLLAVIGIAVYEVFIAKTFDKNSLFRLVIIFIGIILSMTKLLSGQRRKIIDKKKTYSAAYPDLIGNAFADEPKLEKKLYNAIHDYNNDRYHQAIKKLEQLRKECHRSANYYTVAVFTGLCYDELGQYRQAVSEYTYALKITENSTVASNLGICYERLGDSQAAKECYERAIRADGKSPYPLNNLAQMYIREAQFEEALDKAQKAVELDNRMLPALKAVAVCHAVLGNDAEYETAFRKAVACGANAGTLKSYIDNLLEENI